MIRRFQTAERFEPDANGQMQWGPALNAGLIAGVVLLLVPRGSPWSSLSFFSASIMGRPLPHGFTLPLPVVCVLHLVLAEVYGLIIAWLLSDLRQARAIVAGGIIGLGLYLANLALVSWLWPAWRGNELGVLFTHAVFGLLAGGAYRGLLKRRVRL